MHSEHEKEHEDGVVSVDTLLKLLIVAFSAWAGVVGWGVHQVTGQISAISDKVSVFDSRFNDYVLKMEHRMSVLEEYERVQDTKRDQIRDDVERLKQERRK